MIPRFGMFVPDRNTPLAKSIQKPESIYSSRPARRELRPQRSRCRVFHWTLLILYTAIAPASSSTYINSAIQITNTDELFAALKSAALEPESKGLDLLAKNRSLVNPALCSRFARRRGSGKGSW